MEFSLWAQILLFWAAVMVATAAYDTLSYRTASFLNQELGIPAHVALAVSLVMFMIPPIYLVGIVYRSRR
jgi:hypothetical protein